MKNRTKYVIQVRDSKGNLIDRRTYINNKFETVMQYFEDINKKYDYYHVISLHAFLN